MTGSTRFAAGPARMITRRCHSGRLAKLRPESALCRTLLVDAEDPHVPADREHRDLVLGLAELSAHQRPAVAEREPEDLDVQELGRDEVPELVDDHEHADEQQEVEDRHDGATDAIAELLS